MAHKPWGETIVNSTNRHRFGTTHTRDRLDVLQRYSSFFFSLSPSLYLYPSLFLSSSLILLYLVGRERVSL